MQVLSAGFEGSMEWHEPMWRSVAAEASGCEKMNGALCLAMRPIARNLGPGELQNDECKLSLSLV